MSIRETERGTALLTVLLTLVMLMALAATAAVTVTKDTQMRGAFGRSVIGLYAAESGLNRGMGGFRNIFLNFNVPNGSDFAPKTFTLGKRTVAYQLTDNASNPRMLTIPAGEVFSGLNSQQYFYTVKSRALAASDVEAEVGAEFNVGYIPLFQFAAFYNDDLEILPGPEMHLHGRVHTNGHLYLDGGSHLYIEDNPATTITTVQISARGDIYRGRKNANECVGRVTVDKLEDVEVPTPDLDARELACGGSSTRKVDTTELSAWKGSIINNIENIAVPEPDLIDRGEQFWKKADLRIVLRLNQNDRVGTGPLLPHAIEVQDASGSRDTTRTGVLHQFMQDLNYNNRYGTFRDSMPIFYTDVPTNRAGCTCISTPALCNNGDNVCYSPAFRNNKRIYGSDMTSGSRFDRDYRRGGFYNWRERKWMYLLNINIHDLIDWNTRNGEQLFRRNDQTEGGLIIYASVQGPDSGGINNYGVRVYGSADLPIPFNVGDPSGVTVVTDQALYVAGDYNAGVNLPKQPAALIGDSLNIMSNAQFASNCPSDSGDDDDDDGDDDDDDEDDDDDGGGDDDDDDGGGEDDDDGGDGDDDEDDDDDGGGDDDDDRCERNDAWSSLSLGSRRASNTIINAAFLAGVDTTRPGVYNGGLENYPRFHEDWSGRSLTYRGSFVSLGNPRHANGQWCGTGGSTGGGCNIYNPPARLWDYDAAFNNAANLPPMTPRFVYVKQVLFTENFK